MYSPKPKGVLVAEAYFRPDQIQNLADQISNIMKAAVGNDLKFNLRVELGGPSAPGAKAIEELNALLAEVSDELKLG